MFIVLETLSRLDRFDYDRADEVGEHVVELDYPIVRVCVEECIAHVSQGLDLCKRVGRVLVKALKWKWVDIVRWNAPCALE